MPSTTRYKRGDIVLVSFPFTDLSSSKKRPALVVSPDSFNQTMQDVVLAAITTQGADDHHRPRRLYRLKSSEEVDPEAGEGVHDAGRPGHSSEDRSSVL